MTFKGQVAVITGASSGIGRAIAVGLGSKGVALCLIGRSLDTLEAVAERVRADHSSGISAPFVMCYQADLSLDAETEDLAPRLKEDFRRVDLLIHSAGAIALGRLEDSPVEQFDHQYRTNVRAPYVLTKALLPSLKAAEGQIVFINSTVGHTAKSEVSQYAATKHALKAIADSLRDEINEQGVRVLSIFLGRTASPMQAAVHENEGRAYHPERLMQPEDVAAVVLNAVSLPRTAEVTEVSMRPFLKP